jgi:hypothetical protein
MASLSVRELVDAELKYFTEQRFNIAHEENLGIKHLNHGPQDLTPVTLPRLFLNWPLS